MLCGVDAGDGSDIGLGGGCHVAWSNLAEVILSLAATRMLAQVHSWARAATIGSKRRPCLHMQAGGGSKCKACWRWVATRRK